MPPAGGPEVRKTKGKRRKAIGIKFRGKPMLPAAGVPKVRKTLAKPSKNYWDQVPRQSRVATSRGAESKENLRES